MRGVTKTSYGWRFATRIGGGAGKLCRRSVADPHHLLGRRELQNYYDAWKVEQYETHRPGPRVGAYVRVQIEGDETLYSAAVIRVEPLVLQVVGHQPKHAPSSLAVPVSENNTVNIE